MHGRRSSGEWRRGATGIVRSIVNGCSLTPVGIVVGAVSRPLNIAHNTLPQVFARMGLLPRPRKGPCYPRVHRLGRPVDILGRRGDRDWSRAVAAYLARRWTDAPLREIAPQLGLSRADSVPNLTRRVERELPRSAALRADLRAIEDRLRPGPKTKNKG